MKKTIQIMLIASLIASCSPHRFDSEFDFANKLAQEGLWQEAYYRWQKEIDAGKATAALFNNIAVYFEKTGAFEKALDTYQRALKLEPGNDAIQGNLNKLKAYLERRNDKEGGEKNEK